MLSRFAQNSISLGSCIAGIPIKLHITFFLLLVVELFASLGHREWEIALFVFLLYGPILLITILVHEFGHALTTLKLGGQVGGIILWPLGGFALCGPTDGGASADLKVAIAGPLTHLPQMIVWMLLYISFAGGDLSGLFSSLYISLYEVSRGGFSGFATQLCKQTFWMNLYILIFNLFIPAFPLDGGRCLAALLLMCRVGLRKTAMITSLTAFVIALGMAIWGFIALIVEDDPNGIFTIFIAGFVFLSSKELFDLTKAGRVREHPLFSRSCYDEQESNAASSADDEVEASTGTMA